MTSGVVDDERSGGRTKRRPGAFAGSRPSFDSEASVRVWVRWAAARLAVWVRLRLELARERLLALVRLPVSERRLAQEA